MGEALTAALTVSARPGGRDSGGEQLARRQAVRLTQVRPYAGVLSAAAALVVLSGCAGSGDAATDKLSADEAGYRAAVELFTTALSERDADTICGFYNAEDQASLVRDLGTEDCASGVESALGGASEDVRASWASMDVSEVPLDVADDGEYCLDDDAQIPVEEGAWAGGVRASKIPCMIHTGEKWVLDHDTWFLDFKKQAT